MEPLFSSRSAVLRLIRGLFWAQILLFCKFSVAQSSDFMGGESYFSSRSTYGASQAITQEIEDRLDKLFKSIDHSKIWSDSSQPSQRIIDEIQPEETQKFQSIEVIPNSGPQFYVPTLDFNWSQQRSLLDNPDFSMSSGTNWGGSGGGAGLSCAPAKPDLRKLTVEDAWKTLKHSFKLIGKPKELREVDTFVSRQGYARLLPFEFEGDDLIVTGTLERFEAQSRFSYNRFYEYSDIETHFFGKTDEQIYFEISEFVRRAAPGFFLRWQMLKPHLTWKPVRHIELVPDSVFNGRKLTENEGYHDQYIRLSLANGQFDCQKIQVILNRFEATPRGMIPEVSVFYNEQVFNSEYSSWDRAIARIHEEWYVMATLQGHVSSEKVRRAIYTVIYNHLQDYADEKPFFFEDVAQSELKKLVYPMKRLFSEQILNGPKPDSRQSPYFFTKVGTEVALHLESAMRSVLAQVGSEFNPDFVWNQNLTKEENWQKMDEHFTLLEMIRMEAKAFAVNSKAFMSSVDSDEKALVVLIEPYQGRVGEGHWAPRFENEVVLNSPPEQTKWWSNQIEAFQFFCDKLSRMNKKPRMYKAIDDSNFQVLRAKAASWCENVLPKL